MAQRRRGQKPSGGRASKEAIEKRRTARQLNTVLTGGARLTDKLDGRTENRRKRLIQELKQGRGGYPLKPIDFVAHVDELLELGETLGSLRKQGVKPRKTEPTRDVLTVARQTQEAYEFRPEAWRMLGISLDGTSSKGKAAKGAKAGKATKAAKATKRKAASKRKTSSKRRKTTASRRKAAGR